MLVFIDESGDPGFSLAKGASPVFVICLVVFHETEQAEKCSQAITDARQRLGWAGEFKFSKTKDSGKNLFFSAISPFRFDVYALVVDKNNIHSDRLRSDRETFYNYFLRQVLTHYDALHQAKVKIDGRGHRAFRRKLNAYLRRMLGPEKIASIEFVDSSRNNLIQLADMAAGTIARAYKPGTTPAESWRCLKCLEGKLENCWEFK